jgi:hypothetical protein
MVSSGMLRRVALEPHGVTSQKTPFFTRRLICGLASSHEVPPTAERKGPMLMGHGKNWLQLTDTWPVVCSRLSVLVKIKGCKNRWNLNRIEALGLSRILRWLWNKEIWKYIHDIWFNYFENVMHAEKCIEHDLYFSTFLFETSFLSNKYLVSYAHNIQKLL